MLTDRIIAQIRLLDFEKEYQFISESNSKRIRLISIDSDYGPVRLERILPTKEAQNVVVSTSNLEKLASNIKENVPFSIDAIVGASGNWRSVFESILAYTPEFFHCKLNGQKRLVWCPQNPHLVSVLTEIDCATLPKETEADNIRDTLIAEFQYFIENCTKSPNSFRNYFSGFTAVTEYIRKFNPTFSSLLDYTDVAYLQPIFDRLVKEPDFVERDSGTKGKGMYSNAFSSYLMFLRARQYFAKKMPNKLLVSGQLLESDYRSYIAAIKSKPFILLAGISGTGKSRIVRELARACYSKDSEEYKSHKPANFEMIQVRPNWHDSTELLGYVSRLSGEKYIAGDFLKFVVKAWVNEDMPFFLCLDEMNLAPVEQYFAEYLSVIETRKRTKDGRIVTDSILKPCKAEQFDNEEQNDANDTNKGWYRNLIRYLLKDANCPDEKLYALTKQFEDYGISIPQNLIVMGTVNMDETTFSFSRKVLDRAMSIEMNEIKLDSGLETTDVGIGKLEASDLIGIAVRGEDVYSANRDVCQKVLHYLEKLNEKLEGTPFKVAYRTRNEFLLYVVNNLDYVEEGGSQNDMIATALDEITAMKVLSRIEGDDTKIAKTLLPDLMIMVKNQLDEISGKDYMEKRGVENDDVILSVSLKKLDEMSRKLKETGYTSYWS